MDPHDSNENLSCEEHEEIKKSIKDEVKCLVPGLGVNKDEDDVVHMDELKSVLGSDIIKEFNDGSLKENLKKKVMQDLMDLCIIEERDIAPKVNRRQTKTHHHSYDHANSAIHHHPDSPKRFVQSKKSASPTSGVKPEVTRGISVTKDIPKHNKVSSKSVQAPKSKVAKSRPSTKSQGSKSMIQGKSSNIRLANSKPAHAQLVKKPISKSKPAQPAKTQGSNVKAPKSKVAKTMPSTKTQGSKSMNRGKLSNIRSVKPKPAHVQLVKKQAPKSKPKHQGVASNTKMVKSQYPPFVKEQRQSNRPLPFTKKPMHTQRSRPSSFPSPFTKNQSKNQSKLPPSKSKGSAMKPAQAKGKDTKSKKN